MGPRFCKRGNLNAIHAALINDVASMGPRFCKRGNPRLGDQVFLVAGELQWGHAFVSVETHVDRIRSVAPTPLQWGHAFVSVETTAMLILR